MNCAVFLFYSVKSLLYVQDEIVFTGRTWAHGRLNYTLHVIMATSEIILSSLSNKANVLLAIERI
jgi:hypothetical protein